MTDDLAERLVDALVGLGGKHPGHRAAHAKGVLCAATFRPTAAAADLSRASHFAGPDVRAHVRFSNGSGNPTRPDRYTDGRGIAVKFYVDEGTTDVIGLNLPVYFSRTPEDQLAFNQVRRPDPETGQPDMEKVGAFLAEHPETVPAVQAALSLPVPASYVTVAYNSLHAFGFVNGEGERRFGRYRFEPDAGEQSLSAEEAAETSDDFLAEELSTRLASGPARFHLDVRLAEDDDPVDDPTAAWPDDREIVRLGTIEITGLAFDRERDGDILVFDPTRVIDGVELTDDPILHARSAAYRVSVARRTAR